MNSHMCVLDFDVLILDRSPTRRFTSTSSVLRRIRSSSQVTGAVRKPLFQHLRQHRSLTSSVETIPYCDMGAAILVANETTVLDTRPATFSERLRLSLLHARGPLEYDRVFIRLIINDACALRCIGTEQGDISTNTFCLLEVKTRLQQATIGQLAHRYFGVMRPVHKRSPLLSVSIISVILLPLNLILIV
ncbi:hypothetical protein Naga_100027g7 [Nannochloropsis gaditana]|uniref:Uncharacterized protein n=1 Tax=Nannochloropsis gaditana TaxID=72520 RepID=W7TKF2_9STRA|nr:hypothetical protein Naga_100027g7 [Nannochloropsis gaditana]